MTVDKDRRTALVVLAGTVMAALALGRAPKVAEAGGNKHQAIGDRVTALEEAVADHQHHHWPRAVVGAVRQAAAKWELLAAYLEADAEPDVIGGSIGDAIDATFEALDRIDEEMS
jgi:hypothetical protein